MKKRLTIWALALVSLVMLISLGAHSAARAAASASKTRNPVPMDKFPVADTTSEEVDPAAAYNIQDDEYLVVYEFTDFIYGQRVLPDGTLSEDGFLISTIGGTANNPTVAYNHHTGTYVVAWQFDDGSSKDINAVLVHGTYQSSGGQLDSGIVSVAADPKDETHPAIACNSVDSTCLILYEFHFGSGDRDIKGQRMEIQAGSIAADGDTLVLANSFDNEASPALAWGEADDNYLATWATTDTVYGHEVVYFVHIHDTEQGAGTPPELETSNTLAINSSDSLFAYHNDPDVAYSDLYQEYLIVFEYNVASPSSPDYDIYGLRVAGSAATRLDPHFFIAGTANAEYEPVVTHMGGDYPGYNNATHPRVFMVAYGSSSTTYDDYLYLQNVVEGLNFTLGFPTLVDFAPGVNKAVGDYDLAGSWRDHPMVAFWDTQNYNTAEDDIFGNRFRFHGVYVPMIVTE
jgi:hypothetical protein